MEADRLRAEIHEVGLRAAFGRRESGKDRVAQRPDELPHENPAGPANAGGQSPRAVPKSGPPTWVAMSGIGFEFVVAVLLPGALGWWLDSKAGTRPWLMLVGLLLGFGVGLRILMRAVKSK
jgi:hypothetical protein